MIKNDFRYIIKKIIIGIGIIIGVSMIRSCKVYAQDLPGNVLQTTKSYITSNSDYVLLFSNSYRAVYQNKTNGYIAVTNQSSTAWISTLDLPNDEQFYYNKIGISLNPTTDTTSSKIFLTYDTQLPKLNGLVVTPSTYWSTYGPTMVISYGNGPYTTGNFSVSYYDSAGTNNIYGGSTNLSSFNYRSNIEWNYVGTSNTSSTIDLEPYEPSVPEIVSLNPVLNKTDDNMLVSVSFSPEFSFIDTDNYNYYAWFDGKQRFELTENNISFNTQNNTTFYVEITDKQGNSIDTETYTVSSIGLVYNGDYDIQFKTDEYSQSDTENNTDEIFDTINRIDIDIMYIPKWINYKYQYQFVPQNSSLTDDWVLVNDNNDKNNVVYTTNVNGTMYARILDENDNILKSETFIITRIGAIKTYDKNKDKFYGMFNIIKDELNFGGPISDLIVLPVNVLQAISNASNKVCVPYDLGSIGGHHIVFPCIEPEHYLGSALWTTIDLIFSGCMFFAISKWFTSAYYKFILLDNTPGIKGRRDLD